MLTARLVKAAMSRAVNVYHCVQLLVQVEKSAMEKENASIMIALV
jgi:hypothetical protein